MGGQVSAVGSATSLIMYPLPDPSLPWTIPLSSVGLLAEYEQGPDGGVALTAYKCPAGVWTIGWGETDGVEPGDVWTKEEADRRLCDNVKTYSAKIIRMCKVKPNPNELGAFVVLAYNIGLSAFERSTVLRKHNSGEPLAAARAFALWDKYTDPVTKQKVVSNGLTARRRKEAAQYLTPFGYAQVKSPQAVESESSLVTSPIAATGATVTGGGVTIGALSGAADSVKEASTILDSLKGYVTDFSAFLNVEPSTVLIVAAIAIGWVFFSQRRKQREEGWA